MDELRIIMHPSHAGGMATDSVIELGLRLIGFAFGGDDEWGEKYGTDFENDIFLMHHFCWCEKDDGSCLWCLHDDHPNFDELLKPQNKQ